jgi:hypothetical protein
VHSVTSISSDQCPECAIGGPPARGDHATRVTLSCLNHRSWANAPEELAASTDGLAERYHNGTTHGPSSRGDSVSCCWNWYAR